LRLRVLARYGVGLDNVDVDYAISRGIAVVNAPTASSQSVAELTIGLIIVALRSLHLHIDSVKRGVWSKGLYKGRELYGKKLGVIGFGRIGSRVARFATAMGARVLAYDVRDVREAVESVGGELVDLEELLVESDIVTLHVPLTPLTYRMMNEGRLRLLKDGAILVNTSRGPVVDYEALLKHIERLGAVALDVLDEEPPRSPILRRLIEHPKVIVTPHIGAETIEAMERVGEELLAGILEVLGVETPNPRARSAT
jgi:D-3-phosphoglycerate dehydrogenase